MPDLAITHMLDRAASGDPDASERLLPVVYDELRRLAGALLSREAPGQTLQPTALVHEAYLRLIGDKGDSWNGRGHFFGAAAQAMRRILVDRARARGAAKRGGGWARASLDEATFAIEPEPEDTILLDEALDRLQAYDPAKARIVMLRFFCGLTLEQTAAALGLSVSVVRDEWDYARARLQRELAGPGSSGALP